MPAIYTCDCQDGRTLTGTAKWTPSELRQMNPLQLSSALSEIIGFAKYYASAFHIPKKQLETDLQTISDNYQKARQYTICLGITTFNLTFLWALFVIIPALRFSGVTMFLAVLTFFSILFLIPMVLWFFSAQEDYTKRYPRLVSKRDQLVQTMENEVFGKYADYLITGFILTPDYCLFDEGLEYMISALNSKRASSLAEAAVLCKKNLGPSPIPRIVKVLHNVGSAREEIVQIFPQDDVMQEETQEEAQEAKQENALDNLIQLSAQLLSALKHYAANQVAPAPSGEKTELTAEEQAVIDDYRCLTDDEKERIRQTLHSLCIGQY